MKTQDAVERYGSKKALAKKLNITPQAISQWGENLPELQALKLEKLERDAAK
jgi:DNA-binding transcriptional regulator YdaS (Cro superfamily)